MDTGQVPYDVAHKSFDEKQAWSEEMQDALNRWIDYSEDLHEIMDFFHDIWRFPVDSWNPLKRGVMHNDVILNRAAMSPRLILSQIHVEDLEYATLYYFRQLCSEGMGVSSGENYGDMGTMGKCKGS